MRRIVTFILLFLSVSASAQAIQYLFDNKQADKILARSEATLKQANITISRLQRARDELANQMDQALECIKRQKSNYKKLESTLQIVAIPASDPETAVAAETADLAYLKDKLQLVRKRLGTCSLYQLKSKDVIDELDKAIITQTKQQTWVRSPILLNAAVDPAKTLSEINMVVDPQLDLSMMLVKYISSDALFILVLFFILKHQKINGLIKRLHLNPTFLFRAISSFVLLASVHCFWKYQVGTTYESGASQILFKWIILAGLYLLTLGYGAWFLQSHPGFRLRRYRFPMLIILLVFFIGTFALALYGYPYLAYYISISMLNTLEATMLAVVLVVLSRKIANQLNTLLASRAEPAEQSMIETPEMEIEFKVLAISLKASILVGWLTVCINIWQLSLSSDRVLLKYINEGFSFLNINIVPVDFVRAGLIFSIISILIRIIAKTSYKSLNPILLNFSYLVAGLSALFVAGVNLTGIAVVAGALSVGIGMGLRGIVNNFISGIILLIEKPVKRGDRIIVNNVEGYVKNIGLRSTEIQTPTNTDVIVPNEQFITSMVTNYMLEDTSSICNIEVGVAYGSNIELAQEVLINIAKAHPHILSNKKTQPWVSLQTFADSAIVLRLIYSIKHAKHIFRTKSDLNAAIYKAFNENGIAFPFPQQDVYIKEFPGRNDRDKA